MTASTRTTRQEATSQNQTREALDAWRRGDRLSDEQQDAVIWAMCSSLARALGYQT